MGFMLIELLRRRRSVRRFQDRCIEQDKIDLLIESLVRSPSSRGLNPWEFIVVSDPAILNRLSSSKVHGSEFLGRAPFAVVILADPSRCDVWVEDCSITAIILQLTAESLGLGSCWCQIRKRFHADGRPSEDYLKEILDIPNGRHVEAIIGIGYPDETKEPHSIDTLPFDRVYYGRYGQPGGNENKDKSKE